jgi:CheY-like chemotaxis protein
VALTASVLEQDVEACRAAGMDDFVAKPIDADALLGAVARWVAPKPSERAEPPQQPAAPPPVVLDEKILATVEGLVGREALQALAGSFQTELHQRLAAITASRTECKTIEREAHALVSLAGNLGLVELSACSRQLVDACRSAAEGDISKRVRELNEAAERALARLEPLLTLGEMSVDLYRY